MVEVSGLTARRVLLPTFDPEKSPAYIAGPGVNVLVQARAGGPGALIGPADLNTGESGNDKAFLLKAGDQIALSLGVGEILYGMSASVESATEIRILETGGAG